MLTATMPFSQVTVSWLAHICGKTKKGWFLMLRHTVRKRMQATLPRVKIELQRRMQDPVPEVGKWLLTSQEGALYGPEFVLVLQRSHAAFRFTAYTEVAPFSIRSSLPTMRPEGASHTNWAQAQWPYVSPV